MSAAIPARPIPQLDALTGIRGIAAWLVVLFHIRLSMAQLVPGTAIAVLGKGYLAVDLFFMLSGFVIWLNYGQRFRDRGVAEIRHFWWRRFARIWPLHAAILAGLALFALTLKASGHDISNYPLAQLPLHVLLIQNWGLTDGLSWNHPAWSISTELGAYLLFPLAAISVPWERLRPLALLGIAGLLCAAVQLFFAGHGETALGADIPRLGLGRCIGEFLLGVVTARLWQELAGRRGAALLSLLAAGMVIGGGLALNLPETAFVPAGLAALLLALALDRGKIALLFAAAPLRQLGDVSYSTYLLHFPLFVFFKLLFVDAGLQLGWAGLAGFLGLVLACSVLFYRMLERPAQRWLNAHPPAFAAQLSPAS